MELYNNNEVWQTMVRVSDEEEEEHTTVLRKGQWTPKEDSKLTSAIAIHGEGRWSSLAILAGLKRSGKSCRLRWLNYLRPDLRRGSFTLHEQLRILQLHFRWGNRWSKIAENVPGRTDNEIKNYWRTKVQKLARQFQCHVNSPEFRDALRNIWIPRLVEQIQASNNTAEAQTEGPVYEDGLGLVDTYNCGLFDKPTSWAQISMDQNVVGDATLCSKPTSLPYLCEAQISPKSCLSTDLDQNWEHIINDYLMEMTLNYGDTMFFLQQQIDPTMIDHQTSS